jgi:uncharacterized protein
MSDGTILAASLWLPDGDGPFATLLEALPYRKDDITSSYADSYVRFADEGGFAVLRLDLRGTGSSGGIMTDEYTDQERADLRETIQWIADQPWSTGRVGMFGTSYSGFNSLHMACDDVPQLGAIAAMYATDDRFTDDVHYMGGVLRALDLIDYPLYMIAMNALPPVPSEWAANGNTVDWVDEWKRRIHDTPPWLLGWLRAGVNDPQWRRGSVRLGPGGAGYERISCPTMLIAGWADGYRDNTFRTIAELARNGTPWRLLAGPWVHKDPSTARPGPNIDCDRELMAFFDEHLRNGPASCTAPAQIFVRYPTPPAPDLAMHNGIWREADTWPPAGIQQHSLTVADAGDIIDTIAAAGDVGMAAWNSCGGGLPWGQPLDQRADNVRSLTYDWSHDHVREVLGNPTVNLRVASSATVGHVSVKLCDVAADGTSTLITRAMLDLTHLGCWPSDPFGSTSRSSWKRLRGHSYPGTDCAWQSRVPTGRTAGRRTSHSHCRCSATPFVWTFPSRIFPRQPTRSGPAQGRPSTMPTGSCGDSNTTCLPARVGCTAGMAGPTTGMRASRWPTSTTDHWVSRCPQSPTDGRAAHRGSSWISLKDRASPRRACRSPPMTPRSTSHSRCAPSTTVC